MARGLGLGGPKRHAMLVSLLGGAGDSSGAVGRGAVGLPAAGGGGDAVYACHDRARTSRDRHATYIVAALVAGAAGNDWPLSTTPPAQAQRPGGGPRHDVMKHHPQ